MPFGAVAISATLAFIVLLQLAFWQRNRQRKMILVTAAWCTVGALHSGLFALQQLAPAPMVAIRYQRAQFGLIFYLVPLFLSGAQLLLPKGAVRFVRTSWLFATVVALAGAFTPLFLGGEAVQRTDLLGTTFFASGSPRHWITLTVVSVGLSSLAYRRVWSQKVEEAGSRPALRRALLLVFPLFLGAAINETLFNHGIRTLPSLHFAFFIAGVVLCIYSVKTLHGLLDLRDQEVASRTKALEEQRDALTDALAKEHEARAQARKAEAARDQSLRELMLAERMASIGTLAAGVAHEINNPLTFICANVSHCRDVLQDHDALPPPVSEELLGALNDASEGADRIAAIVADFQCFTRAGDEGSSVVDVSKALATAVRLSENELRHRAVLIYQVDDRLSVEANEGRLVQVIVNLLVNAAQAMDQLPASDTRKREVRLLAARHAEQVIIRIEDTGPGIADEHMSRLFDAFFTTKEVGEGTGLGLAICHTIISSFGGKISACNDPHGGAQFKICLPACSKPLSTPRPEPSPPTHDVARRVLVLDDEPMMGAVLKRILSDYEVRFTTDSEEALSLWFEGSFALWLCDVLMPGKSGIDIYQELRENNRSEGVLFMTGGAITPSSASFIKSMGDRVIFKPLTPAKVRRKVAHELAQRARQRQLEE